MEEKTYEQRILAAKTRMWEAAAEEKEVISQFLRFKLQELILSFAKSDLIKGDLQEMEYGKNLLLASQSFLHALAEKEKATAMTLAQLGEQDRDLSKNMILTYTAPNSEESIWRGTGNNKRNQN